MKLSKHAVEHVPAFVGGDRVGGALEHVTEHTLRELEGLGAVALGEGREILFGNPMMRKNEEPEVIVATCLESTSKVNSAAGNSRIMLKSRRAGSVVAPPLMTSASTEARIPVSRSVVGNDELAVNGLDEGVTKYGKRGTSADHVLNDLETGEERFPRDDTFHSQTVLRRFEGKTQWFIIRLITVNKHELR